MARIQHGNFAIELSGADVTWEHHRMTHAGARLDCRICGLEVEVKSGTSAPSCCNQPMQVGAAVEEGSFALAS